MRTSAVVVLAFAARVVAAQIAMAPAGADAAQVAAEGPRLNCDITPIRPALDYTLRLRAGYHLELAMKQFGGRDAHGKVVLEITPAGRAPVYLAGEVRLPAAPGTKDRGETTGWFEVGEGEYRVKATLEDDQARVCRAAWHFRAAPSAGERRVELGIAPFSVAATSTAPFARRQARRRNAERLTVLLHAASLVPVAGRVRDSELEMLVGTLASVAESVPAESVRAIVFNLEQRKILWKSGSFTAADAPEAAAAIENFNLGLVDLSVLTGHETPAEFLEKLAADGGTVVVIGPHLRLRDDAAAQSALPGRVFYLESKEALSIRRVAYDSTNGLTRGSRAYNLDRPPSPDPADAALQPELTLDTIAQWVKSAKGDVIELREPVDLVRVIKRIRARAAH